MYTRSRSEGFTLVELLIVIAIIGILAGMTYASLGGARERAKDRAIAADMNSLLIEARLYRSNEGSYAGLCTDEDTQAKALLDKIDSFAPGSTICNTTATTFGVVVGLHSGNCYCVDSTNYFKEYESETCSLSSGLCPSGS